MNRFIFAFPFAALFFASHFAFAADAADVDKAKQEANERFKAADTNGDGGLSWEELMKTDKTQFFYMKGHFRKMDANGDGKVTPEERDAFIESERAKAEAKGKK